MMLNNNRLLDNNNSATFSSGSGVWRFDQHNSQKPTAKHRVHTHCGASVFRYGGEETVRERKDKCVSVKNSFIIHMHLH